MSLIEKMRASTESTSTRFLIGLMVVLFIGVGGRRARGAGCAGGMAATVNGEVINEADYEAAVRANMGRAGGGLSTEKRAEIAALTLDQLINRTALMQAAADMGLTVSGDEVARLIKRYEDFQKDGKFDEETYLAKLAEGGQDRSDFELNQRDLLLLRKLEDVVGRAVVVTEAEVRREWAEQSTQLEVTYIRLPPANFMDDVVVSDADRDAYVTGHAEAIEARYKADYERSYNLPKRYTLHTILFRADIAGVDKPAVQARAEAVAAEAALPGADFSTLARRWSEDLTAKDGGELGVVPADSLDPALVAVADKTGAGKVSGAVETGRGFQILLVDKIDEARVIPLEEAKGPIAVQMLKDERVGAVVGDYATRLITRWTADAGVVPRDLTEPKALAVEETGGFSLASPTIPKLSETQPMPELTTALRSAKAGDVMVVPFTVKGMQYVVQLTHRTEPDEADYATTGGMMRTRLLAQGREAFIRAWEADVKKSAKVQKFVAVAESAGE